MEHAVEVSALRNDAQILIHRQNLCGSGAEDCLRIGQDDFVHLFAPPEEMSCILPALPSLQGRYSATKVLSAMQHLLMSVSAIATQKALGQ
jgi:hypothetical protein